MIQVIMQLLKRKNIILASSSPRRQTVLKNIGLDVMIYPSLFEENLDPNSFNTFEDFVLETALQKVLEVEGRLKKDNISADVIIGADTMMIFEGKLYGKPESEKDAFVTLNNLSGKCHSVITGVIVKTPNETVKFTEKTDIYMATLSHEQILAYIATGESLDKAGAYGIQGVGGTMVEKIDGDFYNVIGLPLHKLCKTLYEIFKGQESNSA